MEKYCFLQYSSEYMVEEFPISRVAVLSGVNRWTIDYFCRVGIIRPTRAPSRGRGHQRRFSFEDVLLLRALLPLLQAGVHAKKLSAALAVVQERHKDASQPYLARRFLISDGKTVFYNHSAEVVEDIMKKQLAFSFVIDLQKIEQEVRGRMAVAIQA